jgi:hypothetical protein
LDLFWTPINDAVATLVFKAVLFAMSVLFLRSSGEYGRAGKAFGVFSCVFFTLMLLGGIESVFEVAGHQPDRSRMWWRATAVFENLGERGYAHLVEVEGAPQTAVDLLAVQGDSVYCVDVPRSAKDVVTAPRPGSAPTCSPRIVLEKRLVSAIALARAGGGESGKHYADDAAFYLTRLRADPDSFIFYRADVKPNDVPDRRGRRPQAFVGYVRWGDAPCEADASARP